MPPNNNKTLERKVDQILFYLHNDDETDKKGLIAEFNEHRSKVDRFIDQYNTQQAVKKARIGLLAAIGGGTIVLIEKLFQYLF